MSKSNKRTRVAEEEGDDETAEMAQATFVAVSPVVAVAPRMVLVSAVAAQAADDYAYRMVAHPPVNRTVAIDVGYSTHVYVFRNARGVVVGFGVGKNAFGVKEPMKLLVTVGMINGVAPGITRNTTDDAVVLFVNEPCDFNVEMGASKCWWLCMYNHVHNTSTTARPDVKFGGMAQYLADVCNANNPGKVEVYTIDLDGAAIEKLHLIALKAHRVMPLSPSTPVRQRAAPMYSTEGI
jgi:hypothetical protein